jgi:hypothetical protein
VRYLVRSFAIGALRRGKDIERFLSVSQKYEIWLQLIRQEATMAEAEAQWQLDRSTVMRTRTVAKEGALAESRPGVKTQQRDFELEAVKAENARLAEAVKQMAVKQMAVKLTLVEGKGGWG